MPGGRFQDALTITDGVDTIFPTLLPGFVGTGDFFQPVSSHSHLLGKEKFAVIRWLLFVRTVDAIPVAAHWLPGASNDLSILHMCHQMEEREWWELTIGDALFKGIAPPNRNSDSDSGQPNFVTPSKGWPYIDPNDFELGSNSLDFLSQQLIRTQRM